jgi:hypothetical protein
MHKLWTSWNTKNTSVGNPQSTVRASNFLKKKEIAPNKINAALTSLAVKMKVNNNKLSTKIFTPN